MTFFEIKPPQNPFGALPALAERLGVKANEGDMAVTLHVEDGRRYSLFALVNAFLDKIDAAVPK